MGLCCGQSLWHLSIVTVTLLTIIIGHGDSYFEYCSKNSIVTVHASDCPYGVLFSKPQQIVNCMYPSTGEHKPNICSDDGDPESTKKIQLIDVGADDDEGPSSASYTSESCKFPDEATDDVPADKCPFEYVSLTTLTRADLDRDGGEGGFDEFSAETNNSEPVGKTDVQNQTMRLFLHLQDLLPDESDHGPNLRLLNLLEKSFDVLKTHCPTQYVSDEFVHELKRAFLFLLRESDLRHVRDISVNQYAKISAVLDTCLNGPHPPKPFYLDGVVCSSKAKINSILKTKTKPTGDLMNVTYPYRKDGLSFKWGKYDVPVDATWGVMDFTHGLCYGMFNLDVNSHHLYEQALERLFTTELVYRWSRPPKLNHEYYWNHMLRSHVNVTMQNLDACIQASYLDSPFLHRLYRPMVKQHVRDHHAVSSRKKRQTNADHKSVWCFKTQEEKEETITRIKAKQCENQ